MSKNERRDEGLDRPERRKVKVTDKRRDRSDDGAPDTADAGTVDPGAVEAPAGDPGTAEASPGAATPGRLDEVTRDVAGPGSGAPQGDADAEPAPAPDDLAKARAEAAEYLDHLQRLKAEFDNYRKRMLREQTRSVELATESLMSKLLEVLDEFELAVMAAESKPEVERFLRGVEMVYGKLQEILRSEGLERIDARGAPFDPEIHEALLQGDGDGDGEPYVADVLRTGYRLKGRLLRPAGVKVARR